MKEYSIESQLKTLELKVFDDLKKLPYQQKQLLWKLIKNTNKDNLTIYRGQESDLSYLIEKGLIIINTVYKGRKHEQSIIVLPHVPNLLRILKRSTNKKK